MTRAERKQKLRDHVAVIREIEDEYRRSTRPGDDRGEAEWIDAIVCAGYAPNQLIPRGQGGEHEFWGVYRFGEDGQSLGEMVAILHSNSGAHEAHRLYPTW